MSNSRTYDSKQAYRLEIDGLRAFAVLSVVVFHAFPEWLQGGFTGVDIFFVISGFLITGHIFENLDRKRFSFTDFFGRRIRRLFPALIAVMGFSLLIGWFVLVADEYTQLGKHVAGGAAYVVNFILVSESGYFDTAAETKPMLHLWSLAVEEQFYIFWPLALWFAWKRQLNLLTTTVFVALLSFFINLGMVDSKPVESFFLPFTRFWELLSGSILAWLMLFRGDVLTNLKLSIDRRLVKIICTKDMLADGTTFANTISLFGLLMLLYSVIAINEHLAFPSAWALPAIVGTILVIAAGSESWFNRILLMNPVAAWFGVISYPLYLWHWPILSFLQIVDGGIPHREARILAVLFSILFAWLTFKYVETPIRKKAVTLKRSIFLASTLMAVGLSGVVIYLNDGMDFRAVAQLSTIYGRTTEVGEIPPTYPDCGLDREMRDKIAACFRDKRGPIKYAIFGDSKAAALVAGVFRTSKANGRWLMIGGNGEYGAPTPFSPDRENSVYLLKHSIQAVKNNKDINTVALVYAARALGDFGNEYTWRNEPALPDDHFRIGARLLSRVVKELTDAGKRVVLLVDNPALGTKQGCGDRISHIPFWGVVHLNSGSEQCFLTLEEYKQVRKRYLDALYAIQKMEPEKIAVFDTMEIFCDVPKKICLRTKHGRNSFSYSDHISDYMSELIGAELNQFVNDW